MIHPSTTETKLFQNALKVAVDQYYTNTYKVKLPEYYLPAGRCSICLTWDAEPADLDLHLLITGSNKIQHIYHAQMGSRYDSPFSVLGQDITAGYGPERITIYQWIPGQYDIYVHDYHITEALAGSITVQIEIDGQVKYAISRTEPIKSGQAWHPYTITSGKIIPVNDTVKYTNEDGTIRLIT